MKNWPIGRCEKSVLKWDSDIFYEVFSGEQLIFFPEAPTVLCFGFVMKTVLTADWCFSYCWAVLTQHHSQLTGTHKKLGGTQLGQLTPIHQRDIPYHMTLHPAVTSGVRGGGGGHSEWMVFIFPSNCHMGCSPAFLGKAEHLPAHTKKIHFLVGLCTQFLLYLLNCLYLNPQVTWFFPFQSTGCKQ